MKLKKVSNVLTFHFSNIVGRCS